MYVHKQIKEKKNIWPKINKVFCYVCLPVKMSPVFFLAATTALKFRYNIHNNNI